jgi:integrase
MAVTAFQKRGELAAGNSPHGVATLAEPHEGPGPLDRFVENLARRPGKKAGKKLSPATVNRYLSQVSGLFSFGREHMKKSSSSGPPSLKAGERQAAESSRRLAWLAEDGQDGVAASVALLCATGLRCGEFERLEPFDSEHRPRMGRASALATAGKQAFEFPRH